MFFSFLHFLEFHKLMLFQGIFDHRLFHNFNFYQDACYLNIHKYHIKANFLYYFLISAEEAELSISKIEYKSETSPYPKFNLFILRNFSSMYLLNPIISIKIIKNAAIYIESYPVFLFVLYLTLVLVLVYYLLIILLFSCYSYFLVELAVLSLMFY